MTLIWKVKYRCNGRGGRASTKKFTDIVEANDFAKRINFENRGMGYEIAVPAYVLLP